MHMKTIKYNINMDKNMKKKILGWVYYIYEDLFLFFFLKKVLKVNKKYPQLLVNNFVVGELSR